VRQPRPMIDSSLWGCHPDKCTNKRKCDLCDNHLVSAKAIRSIEYGRILEIRKNLHCKSEWVIYVMECIEHSVQYVGSTCNMQQRWRSHKKSCKDKEGTHSGMAKHFEDIHHDDITCLRVTLVDSINVDGLQTREVIDELLKTKEDFWMVNLGTLNTKSGLNTRDEIKRKSRIPNF